LLLLVLILVLILVLMLALQLFLCLHLYYYLSYINNSRYLLASLLIILLHAFIERTFLYFLLTLIGKGRLARLLLLKPLVASLISRC
jgi:hypothetical protein